MGLETGVDSIDDLNIAWPPDSDYAEELGGHIRNIKTALVTTFGADHDNATGKHNKLSLPEQASAPATAANTGFLYSKDVGGITECFYKDSAGNEVQITSAGTLKGLALGYQTICTGPATALSNSVWTKLRLNSASYDPSNMLDTVNSRIVIPSGASGMFLAVAAMSIAGSTSDMEVNVYKNGSSVTNQVRQQSEIRGAYADNDRAVITVALLPALQAGDYIEVYGWIEESGKSGTARLTIFRLI